MSSPSEDISFKWPFTLEFSTLPYRASCALDQDILGCVACECCCSTQLRHVQTTKCYMFSCSWALSGFLAACLAGVLMMLVGSQVSRGPCLMVSEAMFCGACV